MQLILLVARSHLVQFCICFVYLQTVLANRSPFYSTLINSNFNTKLSTHFLHMWTSLTLATENGKIYLLRPIWQHNFWGKMQTLHYSGHSYIHSKFKEELEETRNSAQACHTRANTAKHFDAEEVVLQIVNDIWVNEVQPLMEKLKPAVKLSTEPTGLYGCDKKEVFSISDWLMEFDQHLLRTSTLQATLDASAYQKTLPHSLLQVVVLMILTVPASSAPVERIFSPSGLICSTKMTRLKHDLPSPFVTAFTWFLKLGHVLNSINKNTSKT